MINTTLSSGIDHSPLPLQPGVTLTGEGQALVGGFVNGVFGVKPSTGAAGESFVGFVHARTSAAPFAETTAVKVETTTLPASNQFKLARSPLAGTIHVFDNGANAAIASGSVLLGGDGLTITVTGGSGKNVTVFYTYSLTVEEMRYRIGDQIPGGYVGHTAHRIVSVAKKGTIYHDRFDTSKDWSAATSIKLAAGGLLTDQTGSGVVIPAYVRFRPTVLVPFLGIEFTAP